MHLQRIYNLWSIHAVILSFLDVLQSFYSNFISFLWLTYWPSAQCQLLFFAVPVVVFCLFFTLQKINIKQSPNTAKLFVDFLWTRRHPVGQRTTWGCLEGGTTHQGVPGPPGAPCWVVPPSWHPQMLLWPTGCLLVHKKSTKSFAVFGLRLILISCDVKNKQKNSNWHLALCQ